ncbi:MAG: L,D-transpeptidase [Atopobiaceae bacterium]|nr:L,D-transpeptidase [Atopobiaceae bacterium]
MKRLVTEGAELTHASVDSSARDRVRSRRLARKRRKTLRIVAVVLAICGLVGGTYALGFWYFSSHYYPGTRAVGVDAGVMTQEEFAQAIDSHLQGYQMHASKGGFILNIPGSLVDLKGDANAISSDYLMSQDAKFWPLELLMNVRPNAATLSLDANKLAATVNEEVNAYNVRATRPVSATLKLNAAKDAFELQKEKTGTALDAPSICAVVGDAIAHGIDSVELGEDIVMQPAFFKDSPQAKKALDHANEVFGYDVGFTHDGKRLSHMDAQTFMPWIVVQDDLTLGIDQEAAAQWADRELWYVTDYTDDKNVYSLDTKAFAQNLSDSIRWKDGASFDVPYRKMERYLPGGGTLNSTPWNPELGRYIDVNKKDQVACMFDAKGNVMWETLVTTGNILTKDDTPSGKFGIYDKKTDFVLVGFDTNNDGKSDYQNFVNYWMPFNLGIGLHDAPWRTVFGGEEYKEHGSGGCVNLPVDVAGILYSMAHVGDVVIIH